MGRAISDHALSQALGRPTLACLATAINEDRLSYYAAIAKCSPAATAPLLESIVPKQ